MGEFFFNYGLFAIKAFTLIFLIVIGLGFIASLIANKNKDRECIEIEKMNDHFDALRNALESEILPKREYKRVIKSRKNEEKISKKSKKKEKQEKEKKRLYLLRFDGDLHASEVDNIRKAITAILTFAKPNDEVLVVLESSGGLVHNYGLAASQLKRIRDKHIHLTVAVDLVAASGGYMMACVANKIIAAPFAIVGSIGVLAQLPNFNRLLNKVNVDVEHHTAGEYKSTLTMFGKNSERAREKFKEELEETHSLFKDFVKTNRKQVNIDKIATGEHWYGSQAIDLKLIDEIKTSDDYLLDKSKNYDIYEITYQIHETIRDKINTMIHGAFSKILQKMQQTTY